MDTVMITGVNRGIGLELLRQYAESGWRTIGTCRNPDTAEAAREVAARHEAVSLHALDVTDTDAVEALADELRGTAIDVLILNAGMMGTRSVTFGELDADDFRQVLDVNVVGQAMCLQAFTEHVANSGRRTIVGIGSFLGSMGCSDGGKISYRAAKAGMHALIVAASHDLRDRGITAIVMHPGWVQTDMGGPDATVSTEASVRGMRQVIENIGPERSGHLLTYAGEELPW
jgi:NAD(P)-dependent dehydrogenase (short-subunit alcohol dehydrogenase family)